MSAAVTPTEGKTPREIGREMVRLREQFGLTPQEVAERIHIRPRYITAMEEARYDQMPGKVYARGYIQTYAEFLGMDAAKTIAQCFAGEPVPNAQPVPPPPAATRKSLATRIPPYGPVVAGLAVLALAGIIFSGTTKTNDVAAGNLAESSVAPVPEAILASMRTLVMPTATNYECLTAESSLRCFYTGAASELLSKLTHSNRLPYIGEIDISEWLIAPETTEQTTLSDPATSASEEAETHSAKTKEAAEDSAAAVSTSKKNAAPADEIAPEAAPNE